MAREPGARPMRLGLAVISGGDIARGARDGRPDPMIARSDVAGDPGCRSSPPQQTGDQREHHPSPHGRSSSDQRGLPAHRSRAKHGTAGGEGSPCCSVDRGRLVRAMNGDLPWGSRKTLLLRRLSNACPTTGRAGSVGLDRFMSGAPAAFTGAVPVQAGQDAVRLLFGPADPDHACPDDVLEARQVIGVLLVEQAPGESGSRGPEVRAPIEDGVEHAHRNRSDRDPVRAQTPVSPPRSGGQADVRKHRDTVRIIQEGFYQVNCWYSLSHSCGLPGGDEPWKQLQGNFEEGPLEGCRRIRKRVPTSGGDRRPVPPPACTPA